MLIWAKCPFHGSGEERTASFKVYEETGTYHCFGCKESGNAIHFLRKHDGLDFLEAVETLATQVGMEIPKQEAPVDTSNATKINNRASQVFYEQLKSDQGKKTIKYLKERGISGETAKFFQLGYSSNKKPTLYENLKNEFKEIDLDESGLFGKNDDGEHYDRFRDRLMFPIRNIKGECIAFGGRLLSDKKDQAKYLNSPETKTYKKKYGSRCFLLPSQLKYPVCDKKTGKMNCKGLLAAHYRASLSIRRKLKPKTYRKRIKELNG